MSEHLRLRNGVAVEAIAAVQSTGIFAGGVETAKAPASAIVDRHPSHEEVRFRRDDEGDFAVVDLLRIEQIYHLRILIPEFLIANLRYIEADAAINVQAFSDLIGNAARRDIPGGAFLLHRVVRFHEALAAI
jgi:hypothetical protein